MGLSHKLVLYSKMVLSSKSWGFQQNGIVLQNGIFLQNGVVTWVSVVLQDGVVLWSGIVLENGVVLQNLGFPAKWDCPPRIAFVFGINVLCLSSGFSSGLSSPVTTSPLYLFIFIYRTRDSLPFNDNKQNSSFMLSTVDASIERHLPTYRNRDIHICNNASS